MRFKKFIAFSLIIGSLVFAVLIFTSESPTSSITKIAEKISGEAIPQISTSLKPNSTEELAEKISQALGELNPEGPQTIQNEDWLNVPKPEEIVEKYVKEGIENFKYEELKPLVLMEKLKVIEDNSPLAVEAYLKNFQDILKRNFQNLNIDFSILSSSDFINLITAYDKAIEEFYGLATPKNLLTIHREEIQLLGAQKNIFIYLKNYEQDPLASLLALQANEQIDNELAALKETIGGLINKYNLKIF